MVSKNFKVICRSVAIVAMTSLVVIYVTKLPRGESTHGVKDNSESDSNKEMSCYTCALVGTAGTLLDSKMGLAIDSANCIFRMGFSPTAGKENDVGQKTTARIVDSFRFSRFMKFPEKLHSTSFAADRWYLFDANPDEHTIYEQLLRGDGNKTWIGVIDHLKAYQDLKKYGGKEQSYNLRGQDLSAFWFALHLMEIVSCQEFLIYGVPDPNLCKREPDVDIKSLYWKRNIAPLCLDGEDATQPKLDPHMPQQMPSVLERIAAREWSKNKHVQFIQPTWPDS